jgi:hypothetical protein
MDRDFGVGLAMMRAIRRAWCWIWHVRRGKLMYPFYGQAQCRECFEVWELESQRR